MKVYKQLLTEIRDHAFNAGHKSHILNTALNITQPYRQCNAFRVWTLRPLMNIYFSFMYCPDHPQPIGSPHASSAGGDHL